MSKPHIAVVGAGLRGLQIATSLTPHAHVHVFEKSARYSGRCATLFWRDALIDHGAPYFELGEQTLAYLTSILPSSLELLKGRVIDANGVTKYASQLYYVKNGNNQIGAAIANGLHVLHRQTVQKIQERGLAVIGAAQGAYITKAFDAVVCTAPLPQTSQLLGFDQLPLDKFVANSYTPCLTAVLEYDLTRISNNSMLSSDIYAIEEDEQGLLEWSACENKKEGRIPAGRVVMIARGSVHFSKQYLEKDPTEWVPVLRRELEERWQIPHSAFTHSFAKRWRYARVDPKFQNSVIKSRYYRDGMPIYVACDAMQGQSSIEDALQSAAGTTQLIASDLSFDLKDTPLNAI